MTRLPYYFNASRELWTGDKRLAITRHNMQAKYNGNVPFSKIISIIAFSIFAFLKDFFYMTLNWMMRAKFSGIQIKPLTEDEKRTAIDLKNTLVSYVSGPNALTVLQYLNGDAALQAFRLNTREESLVTLFPFIEQTKYATYEQIKQLMRLNASSKNEGLSLVSLPKVTSELQFPRCPIKDNELKEILEGLDPSTRIRSVYLDECVNLTDEGIEAIAKKCGENLEEIVLVSNFSLKDMPANPYRPNPPVRPIAPALTDNSIHALAKHCPNLRSLTFFDFPQVSEDALITLFEQCNHLSSFRYSARTSTPKLWQAIAKQGKLQTLWLYHSRPENLGLDQALAEVFRNCPITRLFLYRIPLSDDVIEVLKIHRAPELIGFAYAKLFADFFRQPSWGKFAEFMKSCRRLEVLNAPFSLGDEDLNSILDSNTELKKLTLRDFDKKSLVEKVLKTCKHLQSLSSVWGGGSSRPSLIFYHQKFPTVKFFTALDGVMYADLPDAMEPLTIERMYELANQE